MKFGAARLTLVTPRRAFVAWRTTMTTRDAVRRLVGVVVGGYLLTATALNAFQQNYFWYIDVMTNQVYYAETVNVTGSLGWVEWNFGPSLCCGIYSSTTPVYPDFGQPPETCGDDRDVIIAEYANPSSPRQFVPHCSSFVSSVGGSYSFSQWRSSLHNHPNHAIINSDIVSDTDSLKSKAETDIGGTWTLTEGWRCPYTQDQRSPGYPNGRHIFGDASDIDRSSSSWGHNTDPTGWNALKTYAKETLNNCVEPYNIGSGWTHIHMDRRNRQAGKSCPVNW